MYFTDIADRVVQRPLPLPTFDAVFPDASTSSDSPTLASTRSYRISRRGENAISVANSSSSCSLALNSKYEHGRTAGAQAVYTFRGQILMKKATHMFTILDCRNFVKRYDPGGMLEHPDFISWWLLASGVEEFLFRPLLFELAVRRVHGTGLDDGLPPTGSVMSTRHTMCGLTCCQRPLV